MTTPRLQQDSRFKTTALRPLLAALGLLLGGAALAADMELEVQGIASAEGQVMVAAYADPAQWLRGKPVAMAMVPASTQREGRLLLTLRDLPEGRVALSVFHDRNGNGRLDQNLMGLPTEPYGFSNNATGNFGPPAFEPASFEVKAGQRATLRLN